MALYPARLSLSFAIAALSAGAFAQTPSPGADFPEGPGRSIVVPMCGSCHDINRLKAGYTPEGWRTVMRMMQNMDVPVPPDQVETVTQYLIKSFPERPRPAAAVIAGPANATIKLFDVPTPGSRPHDPRATHDGALWYTGQLSNRMGRVDLATGAIKEYRLTLAHSGPHGAAEDKDGNIWFTGNNAGYIGKLDPKTGDVTAYKLPDPNAKDPHTLVFDHDGVLWFTVQQANLVGRLDPKSGEIRLVSVPTARARPYGMAVDSKNAVYFVEFGSNKVASIDRASMQIREYPLPNAGARPRRLAIGPDDTIWYTDFARGMLGHLDPASGKVMEYASPSGPQSEPYGIVFTKGAVWYSESFAKPNTVVRFDPATEKFQTWTIPGGGDIVRNMDVLPNGNPVIADSLTNQVGVVQIR